MPLIAISFTINDYAYSLDEGCTLVPTADPQCLAKVCRIQPSFGFVAEQLEWDWIWYTEGYCLELKVGQVEREVHTLLIRGGARSSGTEPQHT
eukprot:4554800-Pyramimonas_sp.AAC.1